MPADAARFADIFKQPTVEAMYALSSGTEFEHFVAYVLHRAGYDTTVVGPHFLRGVDIEVRLPGKRTIIAGIECKKFAPDNPVRASVVRGVLGAPAVARRGAKPYVITTGDFVEQAHQMAEAGPRHAYLLNGAQLVRYINYVRGSVDDDRDVIASISPEFFSGRDQRAIQTSGGAHILTIANNKGGVGKTTTAYYLGAEFARKGKRVLLIDLDGQANLTECCFPDPASGYDDQIELFPNITEYFSGQKPLGELVKSTGKQNLSIVPSDTSLRLRDLGGSGRPDVETRFARDVHKLGKQQLASLGGTPDWIIIDTPPAMSVFTRAGLAAAHYVLAPVRPRQRTVHGTRMALRTLQTVNALTGDSASFMGSVITHWDDLQVSTDFVNVQLPRELASTSGRIFDTRIPIDNQLETLEPGAKTRGALAYTALAEEVMRDVERRGNSHAHES